MDLSGHQLQKNILSEKIDISALPAGVYIIITSVGNKPSGYNKLVKIR
jgi:hypothetical protein